MSYDTMDPEEFRDVQRDLGLSDEGMARMLGITDPHHIRRLKGDPSKEYFRPLKSWHVRLLRAYLEGYRPADWPEETFTPRARRT